jgi:glutaredoxin
VRHTPRQLLGLALLVLAVGGASQWWAGRQQAALGAEVAALAQPGDIRMLSSATCAICAAARQWFVANQIPFTECTIEHDSACRAAFEASTAPGTPVLLVRGQAIVGFAPARLRAALAASVRQRTAAATPA